MIIIMTHQGGIIYIMYKVCNLMISHPQPPIKYVLLTAIIQKSLRASCVFHHVRIQKE